MAWSIYLLYKLRDWRMSFLTLLLALMASRQYFTLYGSPDSWFFTFNHADEIPGLIVSIFALVMVIAFEKIIERQKIRDEALLKSEEKYRSFVETTDEWIWEIDAEGRNTYSNNSIKKLLGYKPRELVGKYAFQFMLPDDAPLAKQKIEESLKNKSGWRDLVVGWIHKDGSKRFFESNATPVLDSNNQVTGFRGSDRDVTERKEFELKLKLSEERYRMLYEDNPSMFFTIDITGTILSVNNFGAEQLGYSVDELVGEPVSMLFHREDQDTAMEYLENCLIKPDEIHRWEVRKVKKSGGVIWARETARVVYDTDKNPSLFIVCEDFSDTHLLSEQLSYQASHDVLTGLINRREFEIRLNRILETARMLQSEHALCYLDLDQFKVINDACGHMAGDELLRQVSQILRKRIRKRDTLARLGGDEFGILMEYCNLKQAQKVVQEILNEIAQFRFKWEEHVYSIGVSIGLVSVNESVPDKTEALRQADTACYAAKEMGRNRIHLYSDDDIDLVKMHGEFRWISRINRALEKNHFILYGQPIVSISNHGNNIRHYEILIRMQEGRNSEIILPTVFLPAAERYNMITRIDKWVFNAMFDFMNANAEYLDQIDLWSINLSGKSLADDAFLQFIINRIKKSKDLAGKICFEITETAVISNLMRASLFIRKLKKMGCSFSLDDFGSGLSSFAYLKSLPVDYLKIDGLFVRDIVDDETDFAMVKSINDLGQVMGIKTIAEFVENDRIKQRLVDIGVNYAQGYGMGMPMPLHTIFTNYGNLSENVMN